MKQWTIYCHTHIDSGRRYIGLTSTTWQRRWSQHVTRSKNTKNGRWHFPNAIRKYGADAFSHEILEICSTVEEANAAEEKWIQYFDTRNLEKGFNIAKGGIHVPHPIKKPDHLYMKLVDWSSTKERHGEVVNNYSNVCVECKICEKLVDVRVDSLKRHIRKVGLNYECFDCKNHDDFSATEEEKLLYRDSEISSNVICQTCGISYPMTDKSLGQKIRNKKKSGGLIECYSCSMKNDDFLKLITGINQQNSESLSVVMKAKWQDPEFRAKYEAMWTDSKYKDKISKSLSSFWEAHA